MCRSRTEPLDLTKGNVPKQLLRFTFPFLLSSLMQTVYSMVDMLVVGRYVGSAGLAGVSTSATVTLLFTTICAGLSMGGQIVISQLKGARNERGQRETIGTMLTFLMLLAVVLTIPCIFCVRPMLIMLDTPVEAFEYARIYLVICMSGLIFIHGYNGVCTVLQGLGDSFHPMLFVGIACLLNILLDFFLIGWCHWGTAGAAVATVISQAVSFLSSAIYLYRRRKDFVFDFRWKHFRIVPHWLWPICKIGAPVAIQYSVINISVLFIISLVNQYGVSAAAACGVGSKIDSFFIMPINALGTAVSTAVGQNIGSRQQSRAKNVVNWSLLMALSYVAIVIAFVQLRAGMLVRLFDTTPAVVRYGILYLRIVSFGYIARAMLSCYEAMANGVGFTMLTLIACITDGVLVRITLAVVFAQVMHLGLTGVFLGVLCAPYGAALISGAYFYSGRWRDQGIQGTAMDRRSA